MSLYVQALIAQDVQEKYIKHLSKNLLLILCRNMSTKYVSKTPVLQDAFNTNSLVAAQQQLRDEAESD